MNYAHVKDAFVIPQSGTLAEIDLHTKYSVIAETVEGQFYMHSTIFTEQSAYGLDAANDLVSKVLSTDKMINLSLWKIANPSKIQSSPAYKTHQKLNDKFQHKPEQSETRFYKVDSFKSMNELAQLLCQSCLGDELDDSAITYDLYYVVYNKGLPKLKQPELEVNSAVAFQSFLKQAIYDCAQQITVSISNLDTLESITYQIAVTSSGMIVTEISETESYID
ncbi:hypothetical protein [Vibrio sp. D431a]|uniref:hypothetical protein n=1 Tax=Vibrio sp. D431a TaxID=2837388 RepID=UPI0025579820|nr:hypothetical protein [Vibrio sp. D431a]MDK9793320.1 hypothetical protein [Vibrio sp. D431a]